MTQLHLKIAFILSVLMLLVPSFASGASLMKQLEDECIDILKSAKPSVVNVIVEREADDLRRRGIPDPPQHALDLQVERQIGCGIIIDDKGHILTTASVVEDALQILIRDDQGREYPANAIGIDKLSNLAIIQSQMKDPRPIRWGDSAKILPGSWIVNIGSTYGDLHSLSFGMVAGQGPNTSLGPFPDYLQFNAAVNPGDSGGAVVNSKGEAIGVIVAVLETDTATRGEVGFAIPGDRAQQISNELIQNGQIVRAWLGATVTDYTNPRGDILGQPQIGLLVTQVTKGSPADLAGIFAGDILLKFDGELVDNTGSLKHSINRYRVGDTPHLSIWRAGRELSLKVKLSVDPQNAWLPKRSALTASEQREMEIMNAAEIALGKKVFIDIHPADHFKRQRLIHFFWAHYPPGTRDLVIERLGYIEENFSTSNTSGFLTDKGRVYLQFGAPERIMTTRYDRGSSDMLKTPDEVDTWYYYSHQIAFQFGVDNNYVNENPLSSMIRLTTSQ